MVQQCTGTFHKQMVALEKKVEHMIVNVNSKKMLRILYFVVLILFTFLNFNSKLLLAAPVKSDNFEREFYQIEKISTVNKHQKSMHNISDKKRKILSKIKMQLFRFLGSLNKSDSKALEYLDVNLRKKYLDSSDLYSKEFNPSDAIINFEIFDFKMHEKENRIDLRYFLAVMMEGDICSYQKVVSFVKSKNTWLIRSFNDVDF